MTRLLHSPHDRALLARCEAWEIRRYDEDDPRFAYLAARGQLHLQLWHPIDHVSILSPSALTNDRFEISRHASRVLVSNWLGVVDLLRDYKLPKSAELASLMTWLIVRYEVAAYRAPPRARGDA
jgi:hypothetical protein